MNHCILCQQSGVTEFHQNDLYTYLKCNNCDLVFAHPDERLHPDEEKKRYALHENDPDDPDYRHFLNQIFSPLNEKIKPGSKGLDYGSGPGPTLHLMFEEAGHQMEIYDPFFARNRAKLHNRYDFITCTETAEHFYNPKEEFIKLWSLLKTGGYLGIMTHLRPENKSFADWYYIREDTHVALYSEKTFQWLADKLKANCEILGDRVILLEKAG